MKMNCKMSNEEDICGLKDHMSINIDDAKRLYNNRRQREWRDKNKQRSSEIKKVSYRKKRPAKEFKYMEVAKVEQARVEQVKIEQANSVATVRAKKRFPPDNENCDGECDVDSCWNCSSFYCWENEHPYFKKQGLAEPERWQDDGYMTCYVNSDYAYGVRNVRGNQFYQHPVLALLQRAYQFVELAEPVGPGGSGQLRMPTFAEVMALPVSSMCRVTMVTDRSWCFFCNGPWCNMISYDAYGFCRLCSELCPRNRMREGVQMAAEDILDSDMRAEVQAWKASFKAQDGPAWRAQWKAGLETRMARRRTTTVIAARVAQLQAGQWCVAEFERSQ
jgi:hypothetical protein